MKKELRKEEQRELERTGMIENALSKILKANNIKLEKITDRTLQKKGCDVAIVVDNDIEAFGDYKHYSDNSIILELINIKHNPKWYYGYPYLNDYGWSVAEDKQTQLIIYTTDIRVVIFNNYKLQKYCKDSFYNLLINSNISNNSSFNNTDGTITRQKSYAYRGLFEGLDNEANDFIIDDMIRRCGCWIYTLESDTLEIVKGDMLLSDEDIKKIDNNLKELKEIYLSKKNTSESAKTEAFK